MAKIARLRENAKVAFAQHRNFLVGLRSGDGGGGETV